jgi:segregation and condensation protein B
VIGKPLIYGTTQEFLETFGLKDIKSLPTLKETGDLFIEGEIEEQKEFLFADEEDQA